jgi:RNA polymerase sigma-70 factor (ECF subfamily)
LSNPLASDDPNVWNSLVEAAHPASILVVIGYRMGSALRQCVSSDDIFQEALLNAWEARREFTWQGTPSFRRWLLRIAERCIEDQRDHVRAQKRDFARTTALAAADGCESGFGRNGGAAEPWTSTTPSRIVAERERAEVMERALQSLPDEVRDVVRLRLFEDSPIAEIATSLGLGESAVRHRFRKGAELYRQLLRGGADDPGQGLR